MLFIILKHLVVVHFHLIVLRCDLFYAFLGFLVLTQLLLILLRLLEQDLIVIFQLFDSIRVNSHPIGILKLSLQFVDMTFLSFKLFRK